MKLKLSPLRFFMWVRFKILRVDACWDIYPYYGVGPHKHLVDPGVSFSTIKTPKEEWPGNYVDTDDGCGMWYCPDKKCRIKNCGGRQ
jgi:hypothetical protein